PGLAADPGHAVAKKQMQDGFGGMLSIRVAGGEAAAVAAAARVKVWKRATSLGGVESLVEHRASVEGAGSPAPPDLLRLSVGLEHVGDLIADLEQALAATGQRSGNARGARARPRAQGDAGFGPGAGATARHYRLRVRHRRDHSPAAARSRRDSACGLEPLAPRPHRLRRARAWRRQRRD